MICVTISINSDVTHSNVTQTVTYGSTHKAVLPKDIRHDLMDKVEELLYSLPNHPEGK